MLLENRQENLDAYGGDELTKYFSKKTWYLINILVTVYVNRERKTNMNAQINIAIPKQWKDELKRLARIYSVEEENTLTYLDLIRRAIKEKYYLKE